MLGTVGLGTVVAAAVPAGAEGAADFVGGARYNAGVAVFVAKDQGGGAYWLSTTTAATSVATATTTGRDALLTVNSTVLVPVEEAIGG